MERRARLPPFLLVAAAEVWRPPAGLVRPDGAQQSEPRDGRVRPGGRAGPAGRVVTRCYAEGGGGVRVSLLCGAWWALQDLNLGPMDYESTALTAELRAR